MVSSIRQELTNMVESGKQISLRWIPKHHGVCGNETADCAAKQALCYPFVDAYEKLSLDTLEALVTFKMKDLWNLRWRSSDNTTQLWNVQLNVGKLL